MIAFEMAVQLEAQGLSIGFLALMDAPGPRMRLKTLLTKKRQLARFTAALHGEAENSRVEPFPRSVRRYCTRKLRNFLVYESDLQGQRFSKAVPIPSASRGARPRRPVPRFLQGISVETARELWRQRIMMPSSAARGEGPPLPRERGEGNDEAIANRTSDPLLDWGGRVKGELEVIGHTRRAQQHAPGAPRGEWPDT